MTDTDATSDPEGFTVGVDTVAVAVCTRGRPRMLASTLASLDRLEPRARSVVIIVVHNDPGIVTPPQVDRAVSAESNQQLLQVVEPATGIAPARNRALDEALRLGCRWLAFIDDDEVADAHWLDQLLTSAVERKLVLVGGPVRMQPPPVDATPDERAIWRGVTRRFAEAEQRAARKVSKGRDAGITIVTNNWLCDLDFVRDHALRFDSGSALSGGEDTQFYRDVVRKGGTTGWAPGAVVYEEWPRERLTLAYHRKRGRDQAVTRFRGKLQQQRVLAVPEAALVALARVFAASFWQARSLFDGGASRVRAARSLGAAAGVIAALRGVSSSHYEQVTGD